MDEILERDHPNETSLVVLALRLHVCVCFSAFYKMKFEFFFNFGKEMVNPIGPKSDQHQIRGGAPISKGQGCLSESLK